MVDQRVFLRYNVFVR